MLSAPEYRSLGEVAKTLIRPIGSPPVVNTPIKVVGFWKLATEVNLGLYAGAVYYSEPTVVPAAVTRDYRALFGSAVVSFAF